ncbi:MAG: hypothetical protein OXI01_03675 [Albidovulum sp.]|nr:hypothetical protein [Albidovulum sp.]
MDTREFTRNYIRASALRILRDRIDIINPDRPRLDSGLLGRLPAERPLNLQADGLSDATAQPNWRLSAKGNGIDRTIFGTHRQFVTVFIVITSCFA